MVSAHAYPWDVLGGDPFFFDRAAQLEIESVTLAVAYHSTRAATPNHPSQRYVDAHYAALYRPVRAQVWRDRRLTPLPPQWMQDPDPALRAAELILRGNIGVNAWIVLAHNTRLGLTHPDLTVLNCFGERYPYALCPSQAEVRDHCATLAQEALHDLPVTGVSLESVGQMGAVHLGCHEKTDGAYTQQALRALSVCCCSACTERWRDRGLSPIHALPALRAAATDPPAEGWTVYVPEFVPAAILEYPLSSASSSSPSSSAGPAPGAGIPDEMAAIILASRHEAADELRGEVLQAVRQEAPGVPVTLHAHPDPWATGPSPGLTSAAAAEVDRLLVPCWPTTEASAELIRQATAHHAGVDAYVTALLPAIPDALPEHGRRLRAAGATGLGLYHLGLVPSRHLNLLRQVAEQFQA